MHCTGAGARLHCTKVCRKPRRRRETRQAHFRLPQSFPHTKLISRCAQGVVFAIKVVNAKNIIPYSWFGDAEGELMLSPNMRFVVTRQRHCPPDGPLAHSWVIEMQQIPDQTLWS